MAIMIAGWPGSGKSYTAMALCVVPALEAGRPVRTNIPLQVDAIRARWPEANIGQIDPLDQACWETIPGGALVVIDEIAKVWPAGQRAAQGGKAVEWLSMHRHRVGEVRGKPVATDVVLLSQGTTDLARWARSKVDRTYIVRKLDSIGADRRYRCDWYEGFQDHEKPLQRSHISGGTGMYKPEVYSLYRSHTKCDAGVSAVGVSELRADGRKTIWSSGLLRMAGAALVALVVVSWYVTREGGAFFVPAAASDPQVGEAVRVQSVAASPATTNPERELASAKGSEGAGDLAVPSGSAWRLSAWIGPRADGRYAVVARSGRTLRHLSGVPCGEGAGGEWGCDVDGERITMATGGAFSLGEAVDPEASTKGSGYAVGSGLPADWDASLVVRHVQAAGVVRE